MGTTEPPPDAGSSGQKRSRAEVDQLVSAIRQFGEMTGKTTQYQQAEALGVPSSSFSRWLNGEVPSERTFAGMLQHVRLSAQERLAYLELRQRAAAAASRRGSLNNDNAQRPPSNGDQPAPPARPRWWLAGGVALAVTLISVTIIVLVNRQPGQPGQSCDRYEVTAETLAIRSASGEQTGEYYAEGRQLHIQRRTGPAGGKYWYVVDDKGREGWVLPSPRWWRPVC